MSIILEVQVVGIRKMSNYAKNREIARSIHDEVLEFFNFLNTSNRIMAPDLPQLLTEVSTKKILLEGKARPARKAVNNT
jgi:hypothetical protein